MYAKCVGWACTWETLTKWQQLGLGVVEQSSGCDSRAPGLDGTSLDSVT